MKSLLRPYFFGQWISTSTYTRVSGAAVDIDSYVPATLGAGIWNAFVQNARTFLATSLRAKQPSINACMPLNTLRIHYTHLGVFTPCSVTPGSDPILMRSIFASAIT